MSKPLTAHIRNIHMCHSTIPTPSNVPRVAPEPCVHGGVTRLCDFPVEVGEGGVGFTRHRRTHRRGATLAWRGDGFVVPETFHLWIVFTTEVRGHSHSTTAHHHQIHNQAQTHDNCNTTSARLPAKVHLTSGRPWRGFPSFKLLLFECYEPRPACRGALQALICNRGATYLIKLLYKSRKLVKIKLLCLQRHVCDPIKHNNR
ncbi:hypothetical protein E2C01_061558 [Portunus trituberculatus]|uniref:Uncharacterized protein n=1 Tax=Portunus trituberculatus TaxID=210409 RepID=A0A5B7HBB2_PORTR|nr:hypothetical protein [Portunus trituberculatus]